MQCKHTKYSYCQCKHVHGLRNTIMCSLSSVPMCEGQDRWVVYMYIVHVCLEASRIIAQ